MLNGADRQGDRLEDSPAAEAIPAELERALVDRARCGDSDALAALYDAYLPKVYRYVAARVGSPHEAEDLTEEIFVKMLGAIGDFRWKAVPFSAWLFRIAHNHLVSHFRRSALRRGSQLSESLVDEDMDPPKLVEARLVLDEVRRATAQLPDAQREVITLRFVVGLSVSETARVLGKRENNVKALQHKAVARLQRMLAVPAPGVPAPINVQDFGN